MIMRNQLSTKSKEFLNLEEELYKSSSELKHFKNGYGTIIVSTNKGVIANDEAFASKVGGEVLCTVW